MRILVPFVAMLVLMVPGLSVLGGPGDAQFGECGEGNTCSSTPDSAPFPPAAVTGHSVYARFVETWSADAAAPDADKVGGAVKFPSTPLSESLRRPTASLVPMSMLGSGETTRVRQAECVAWANGYPVDQRPDPDAWSNDGNNFPGDEDEPMNGPVGPVGGGDIALQDYDFDRLVASCAPDLTSFGTPPAVSVGLATDFAVVMGYYALEWVGGTEHGRYAVVVEKGDCDPSEGVDFRFRGHLDFVDPDNNYHEVQEYDYRCPVVGPEGNVIGAHAMKDLYPWTYTDAHNLDGCDAYKTPLDDADPGSVETGSFDLGHKCNGTWQDLATERMWITELHDATYDQSVDEYYTFALQIDTCSGFNVFEGLPLPNQGPGNPAQGPANDYGNDGLVIEPHPLGNPVDWYAPVEVPVVGKVRPSDVAADPFPDVCADGSSLSFDDTRRARHEHHGPPAGRGDPETMRGNAYDFDPDSVAFGKHRWNCRANVLDWRFERYPPGPPPVGADCYPEDHSSAEIDIYMFSADPTDGLFWAHSNALTGDNEYAPPNHPTGP